MIIKKNSNYFSYIILCIFILSLLSPQFSSISQEFSPQKNILSSTGWVENIQNVTILHIQGNYYEMGYQHGTLLKKQVLENYRAILDFALKKGISYDELSNMWSIMKDFVPKDYLEEMKGLSDGCGLSYDEINAINMVPTILGRKLFQCSSFSAWGNATQTGELIHAKSYDYPLYIQDPLSQRFIQENQAIMIREPLDGYASLNPIVIGLYGSGGINEKGLAMASLYSWTNDQSIQGTPRRFKIPLVMDKAATINEAIAILFSNTTLGYNTILADAKTPVGIALEETKNQTYVGYWNTSSESTKPFWSIKQVVRRTNLFVNTTTASTQRLRYDPKSMLLMFLGKNDYYPMFLHYKALSTEIEKKWGELNLENSLHILRDTYEGTNNSIISKVHRIGFINDLAQQYGYLESLHQMTSKPLSGDIYISFADQKQNAWKTEIYQFNFFDLLNNTPP